MTKTKQTPLTNNQINHEPPDGNYEPIENYGIIGNLHTVALVSKKGSIDFMSFTRFDSPTVFAKLLDAGKGGNFCITPIMRNMTTKQLYLPNTNVLVTRYFAEEGIAELIDYMPVHKKEGQCAIIRKITTVRGNVRYHVRCAPRFNYAGTEHVIAQEEDSLIFTAVSGNQLPLRLTSDQSLKIEHKDVVSEFVLKESETASFVLEADNSVKRRPELLKDYIKKTYRATINFWQDWISKSTYNGQWTEVVNRSALTLKLLTSYRYGTMVAAATFGLPERIRGVRNWDYRYTWIRDAAFTVYAFLKLGYLKEAQSFIVWIAQQIKGKKLQLMYAIDGETNLNEQNLDYLEGYKRSKPVVVGNDAHKQFQLDIYGELLDTINTFIEHGGEITYEFWREIENHVEFVIDNWQKPDHSIWEVRGEKREFLYSRVMCWVALDRAIKIGDRASFPYDFVKWKKVRNTIFQDIYDNFWSDEKQSYVQSKASNLLDASVLIMPLVHIISPYSERWQKTMKAVDRELRSDVLIYRYREKLNDVDGIKGTEGTFSICSFWHVECLAKMGEIDRAKEHFEKMLGYANHLGLFSEEIGMRGQHLGNFPQAFTHLALISAVMEMNKEPHLKKKSPEPAEKELE